MKTIGIIANCAKPQAASVVSRVVTLARKMGMKTLSDPATASLVKNRIKAFSIRRLAEHVDVILALGGDGTVLRVVRLIGGKNIPMMGINLGGLGFLTSVAEMDVEEALEAIRSDSCQISSRSLISCALSRKQQKRQEYFTALNDIVVASSLNSRIITLDVHIEGKSVASYSCDGIIVATPTGSTGHSLSAGGPIVMPEASVLVISLICPHTLSYRPIVLPDNLHAGIRVTEKYTRVHLSVDGQI